jgi:hypothetical protein
MPTVCPAPASPMARRIRHEIEPATLGDMREFSVLSLDMQSSKPSLTGTKGRGPTLGPYCTEHDGAVV